jgi:hypothetical protein
MDDLQGLREEVGSLKSELESLKSPRGGGGLTQYLDPSGVVAVLALLFSFGTTYVSYQRSIQEDIHASQLELRGLVRSINDAPKRELELESRHGSGQARLNTVKEIIRDEQALLAKQADRIIRDIPST